MDLHASLSDEFDPHGERIRPQGGFRAQLPDIFVT
jgi:hypothetical protein